MNTRDMIEWIKRRYKVDLGQKGPSPAEDLSAEARQLLREFDLLDEEDSPTEDAEAERPVAD
jgi:hypothetical protein